MPSATVFYGTRAILAGDLTLGSQIEIETMVYPSSFIDPEVFGYKVTINVDAIGATDLIVYDIDPIVFWGVPFAEAAPFYIKTTLKVLSGTLILPECMVFMYDTVDHGSVNLAGQIPGVGGFYQAIDLHGSITELNSVIDVFGRITTNNGSHFFSQTVVKISKV